MIEYIRRRESSLRMRRSACGGGCRRAMSLIELMVVVAIIAILVGLMLPAIQKVRISARRAQSVNNVKQMSLAVHEFYNVHGFLPPALGWDNIANKSADGGANGTVFFLILPYMEYDNLYQQFFGPLNSGCGSTQTPVGAAAYRANHFGSGGVNSPKQFTSPLDASAANSGMTTFTSYLANKDLLDKRLGIEKVSNGSSNTILLTEGVRSCRGKVYDPLNYSLGGVTATFQAGPTNSWTDSPSPSSFTVGRVNNWAVGTEIYNYDTGSFVSTVTVMDYTDPNNPKNIVMDLQDPNPAEGSGPCCTDGCSSWVSGVGNAVGNIPVFHKVDPYYEPAYYFTSSGTQTNTWDQNTLQWTYGPIETTTQITPFTQPMRATYQDGRSWYVNPALATTKPAPPSNCLPFGAQAHYGDLIVAMLDGSVHSVGHGVSPDSWNAAISPFTNGVPVGPDFFDN